MLQLFPNRLQMASSHKRVSQHKRVVTVIRWQQLSNQTARRLNLAVKKVRKRRRKNKARIARMSKNKKFKRIIVIVIVFSKADQTHCQHRKKCLLNLQYSARRHLKNLLVYWLAKVRNAQCCQTMRISLNMLRRKLLITKKVQKKTKRMKRKIKKILNRLQRKRKRK